MGPRAVRGGLTHGRRPSRWNLRDEREFATRTLGACQGHEQMCKGKRLKTLARSRKHAKVRELQEGNVDGKESEMALRWQARATSCRAQESRFQPLKNFVQKREMARCQLWKDHGSP